MNGGIVPLLLLSATLGLMLGFAPRRTAIAGLAAFSLAALGAFVAAIDIAPDIILAGLWLTIITMAAAIYFPVAHWARATLPLSVNAGVWAGLHAGLSASHAQAALGLVPALVALSAAWLVRRQFAIVIKVAASWMIAIASLALFVSLMPTPGYKPDHME